MKINIGDFLIPSERENNKSIKWKSSIYYIVDNIIYDYNNVLKNCVTSYQFVNENGEYFQEGFYFIDSMIEKKKIIRITSDDKKAKILLTGGSHNNQNRV